MRSGKSPEDAMETGTLSAALKAVDEATGVELREKTAEDSRAIGGQADDEAIIAAEQLDASAAEIMIVKIQQNQANPQTKLEDESLNKIKKVRGTHPPLG